MLIAVECPRLPAGAHWLSGLRPKPQRPDQNVFSAARQKSRQSRCNFLQQDAIVAAERPLWFLFN
jgi:hypothetical protein